MKPLLFTFLFLMACPAFCADEGNISAATETVRIGLAQSIKEVVVEMKGISVVTDIESGRKFRSTKPSLYRVKPGGEGKTEMAGKILGPELRIMPIEGQERVRFNGKEYRGGVYIKLNKDQTLTVIEEVGLEEYLYGVLPLEMGPNWPLEALKAQAVVARTYTLTQLKRFSDSGYDLSADVKSQVYGGSTYDYPAVLEAVRSTAGEVLTYKGKLVEAYYHAACGGHTTSPLWDDDVIKPLRGVFCKFCRSSPNYKWTVTVSNSKVLDYLQSRGLSARKVTGIKSVKKNRSGRTLLLKFTTDKGSKTLDAKEFRTVMGNTQVKSTYFTSIQRKKDGFRIYGQGYGHGAGMCQDGASEMAKRGRKYKQILEFYYPDSEISDWRDADK
ncbi:MAG: SpoIID/LytB domain-containing protein [Elusimicrobia bacterium]|nr:SpoIID/LytB domain-containing protein [Elusimicrobiota bacterium]